jgi:hypothetical protein
MQCRYKAVEVSIRRRQSEVASSCFCCYLESWMQLLLLYTGRGGWTSVCSLEARRNAAAAFD